MDQPVGQSLWDRQPPSVSCGTDSHGQPAVGQTATMNQLWDRRSASFRTDSHDQSAVGQIVGESTVGQTVGQSTVGQTVGQSAVGQTVSQV